MPGGSPAGLDIECACPADLAAGLDLECACRADLPPGLMVNAQPGAVCLWHPGASIRFEANRGSPASRVSNVRGEAMHVPRPRFARLASLVCVTACVTMSAGSVLAQSYPSKPI